MIHLLNKALRLLDNSLTYVDQAVVSGSNFLVGILLARTLGMDAYGIFVLGWMVVLFASSLQQAIVLNPLYTLLPKIKDADKKTDLKAGIIGMQACLSLLTVIMGFAIIPLLKLYLPNEVGASFHIFLPLIMGAFVTQDFLRKWLFVKGNTKQALIGDIVGYALQLPALAALWFAGLLNLSTSLMAIGTCMILSCIVLSLLSGPEAIKQLFTLRLSILTSTLVQCWKFSRYLIATTLLQWFSGNIFIVVAGGIVGPAAVGAIRIAQNVMGVLHVLFLALENIVPIKAAKVLSSGNSLQLREYFKSITLKTGSITLILASAVALFSEQILTLLYGPNLAQHAPILVAFAALYILIFLGTILRFYIRTIEKNHFIFISYMLTAAFSLMAAEPIVTHYGLQGIIIGLFCVHAITLLVFTLLIFGDELYQIRV